jgi:hypothetical protein
MHRTSVAGTSVTYSIGHVDCLWTVCMSAIGRRPAEPRRWGTCWSLCIAAAVLLAVAGLGCDSPGVTLTIERRSSVRAPRTLELAVRSLEGEVSRGIPLKGRELPLSVELLLDGRSSPISIAATAVDDDGIAVGGGEVSLHVGGKGAGLAAVLMLDPADFVVNSTVEGDQRASQAVAGAQVAAAPGGEFMVVFESDSAVVGRAFDRNGQPATNDVTSNAKQFPISDAFGCCLHFNPTVAHSQGGFLVAWENYDNQTASPAWYLWAAAFSSDGKPNNHDLIAPPEGAINRWGAMAGLAGGGFVVTWLRSPPEALATVRDVEGNIFARIIAPDGVAAGGEIAVATAPAGTDYANHVAALADGGFVVVWDRKSVDRPTGIVARLFSSTGAPRTGEIAISGPADGEQLLPAVVGTPDGGFAVAWMLNSAGQVGVMARVLDAAGRGGTPTLVGKITGRQVMFPALSVREKDRAIAVAWADGPGVGPDTYDIFMQLLDGTGTLTGERMTINTTTEGGQHAISLAPGADDSFIVVWTDDSLTAPDTAGASVRARLVYPPLATP